MKRGRKLIRGSQPNFSKMLDVEFGGANLRNALFMQNKKFSLRYGYDSWLCNMTMATKISAKETSTPIFIQYVPLLYVKAGRNPGGSYSSGNVCSHSRSLGKCLLEQLSAAMNRGKVS